jgi:hypothetical protein
LSFESCEAPFRNPREPLGVWAQNTWNIWVRDASTLFHGEPRTPVGTRIYPDATGYLDIQVDIPGRWGGRRFWWRMTHTTKFRVSTSLHIMDDMLIRHRNVDDTGLRNCGDERSVFWTRSKVQAKCKVKDKG